VWGTAEATVNAIQFREARVNVTKRKRAKASQQGRHIAVLGRDPAVMPFVWFQLEQLRRRHEKGDPEAALEALEIWLDCFIGPPAWAADAFVRGWRKWRAFEAPTLGAAFGVIRRSGKQLESLREHEEIRARVLFQIERLHRRGRPIGGALFAEVGEEIGRSASYVSDLFYDPASDALKKVLQKIRIS